MEANPTDNDTRVKVKLKFVSNKTDNNSITDEILNKLRLSKENISSAIKIDSNCDEPKSILKSEVRVSSNISNIKVDYRFVLNETNRTEMINGIYNNLSNLTAEQILGVLEIKTLQDEIKSEENNNKLDENDGELQENDEYGTRQRKDNNRNN